MSRRHTTTLRGLTFALGVLPATTLASALLHHNHKVHIAAGAAIHPRQDSPDPSASDLLGIGELPPLVPTSIPEITFTIVPIPASPSSGDDSTALPTIELSSIPGFNGNGSFAVPNFPTSTVQEAVATVCPNATAVGGGLFTVLPFPFTSDGGANQQQQTTNATATLSEGSSTIELPSSAAASVSASDDAAAHVSFGADGCQTLYTPAVKAVCSTTISPLGVPAVTVTECDQWVTFSSQTAAGASAVPAEGTSQGAVKRQAAPSSGQDGVVATPAAVTVADPLLIPAPTAAPSPGPGTYYAVPWYDAVRGGVPPRVRAVECLNDDVVGGGAGGLGGCSTWEERWSETRVVRTVSDVRRVTYSGPVVVTDGTNTYTTTISIATVVTETTVTTSPSVVKRRLFSDGEGASTVRMTATLTETEYQGVATSVFGGVRTVELVEVPGVSAV